MVLALRGARDEGEGAEPMPQLDGVRPVRRRALEILAQAGLAAAVGALLARLLDG